MTLANRLLGCSRRRPGRARPSDTDCPIPHHL